MEDKTNITTDDLAFVHGDLGRVKRIVSRHKLKDQIALYKQLLKTHHPLVQAMKVTQQAFQQGVMEGIRQVSAAQRKKEEAENVQAKPAVVQTGFAQEQPCPPTLS